MGFQHTSLYRILTNFLKIAGLFFARAGFLLSLAFYFLRYLIRYTLAGRAAALLILTALLIYFSLYPPLPEQKFPESAPVTLRIPAGATFRQVADSLKKANLLEHERWFLLLGKLSGKEKNVRAGWFSAPRGLSAWQLLNYLEKAPALQIKVTLPEGLLASQMAEILQEKIGIDSSAFVSLVYDSVFTRSLAGEVPSLEGYLAPETYYFEWKTPEAQVLERMVANTLRIFQADSVQQRLQELKMTPREILILASIIEGEVMVDSERVYISSLYHNRLRLKWPLQADPTIQFIIPGPPRRLLYRDLEVDSPYNTYKNSGLPPGPINNPGRRSILAALYPASSSYLYMVAAGDGRHRFSSSLKEHNHWHAKFNEVRRQARQNRRNQNNGDN